MVGGAILAILFLMWLSWALENIGDSLRKKRKEIEPQPQQQESIPVRFAGGGNFEAEPGTELYDRIQEALENDG